MTAYPAWTPASRPGIVPLHPYGFGTILGRSFVALRHNPKVLLGFALAVQAVAYVIVSAALAGVALASFSRLDTLVEGSDDFQAVMWGSIALTGIAALVVGAAASALSVLVQGIVVSEVAHAVVAEKPTLRVTWRRVRPVFWRLIGYAALMAAATLTVVAVLAGIITGLAFLFWPLAIVVGILLVLAMIPLYLWISTKLFLVPSVIILEGAGVRQGIARSWRLTRGRFWSTLGVIVIISIGFSVIAQVISIPLSLLSGGMSAVIAPTGASEPGTIVAFIAIQAVGQIGILLVQCIALVVQSTAAVLVYVDARMRVEGLDHDLHSYVEARDAGGVDLPDPYRAGVGRALAPAAAWGAPAAPGWGASPPPAGTAFAAAPPAGAPYAAAPYGTAPAPAGPPYGGAPAPAAPAPAGPPAPVAPPAPPAPTASPDPAAPPAPAAPAPAAPAPPAPTDWAAPGSPAGHP